MYKSILSIHNFWFYVSRRSDRTQRSVLWEKTELDVLTDITHGRRDFVNSGRSLFLTPTPIVIGLTVIPTRGKSGLLCVLVSPTTRYGTKSFLPDTQHIRTKGSTTKVYRVHWKNPEEIRIGSIYDTVGVSGVIWTSFGPKSRGRSRLLFRH